MNQQVIFRISDKNNLERLKADTKANSSHSLSKTKQNHTQEIKP